MSSKPDATFHEARASSASRSPSRSTRPSPSSCGCRIDLYETRTEASVTTCALIAIRRSFLSRKAVRNAYLGYATQQFRRAGEPR